MRIPEWLLEPGSKSRSKGTRHTASTCSGNTRDSLSQSANASKSRFVDRSRSEYDSTSRSEVSVAPAPGAGLSGAPVPRPVRTSGPLSVLLTFGAVLAVVFIPLYCLSWWGRQGRDVR